MYKPTVDFNPKIAELRILIRKSDCFTEAMSLCISLHNFVHVSTKDNTLGNLVKTGLVEHDYQIMPTKRDVTIAWNIWHITRIEDITMNLLVGNTNQVLDTTWLKKLGTTVTDTGNAMSDPEILSLSRALNIEQLWKYRSSVKKQSQEILSTLTYQDLKRKFTKEQTDKIVEQGGLISHPDSIWLKDFWGKKTVAGILLLPLTRHQAGHLNDCLKLKQKIHR